MRRRKIDIPRTSGLVFLVLIVAGCGGGPPSDANLVVNAFHGGGPAGAWERANLERFAAGRSELVPYVRLFDIYNDPVAVKLRDRAAAEAPPDVITSPIAGALRDLAAQGLLADLTDLWAEQGWDERFPATVSDLAGVDGRKYFVPQAIQWNPLYYRVDVFEKLDLSLPATWDDFLATCERLHDAGYVPVTISTEWSPPVARWFSILDLRLNGPRFHEELMRGRVRWDDPRVRRVFEHWAELFDRHCFVRETEENDFLDATNQLARGEAAMWLIGEWLYEFLPPEAGDKLAFFAFPKINPTLPRGEIVHVYGAFMPAKAAHPGAARDYLAYLGGKESQTSNARTLSRLVSNPEVGDEVLKPHHLEGRDFVRDADHLTPLFEFSTDRQVAAEALEQFVRFWKDRSVLDDVLKDLEAARQKSYGDSAAPPSVLAIRDVTVLDMTGAPPRPATTVVVTGNRLTEVGAATDVAVPDDAREVDGRGRFLIPGLWDMHVHVMADGVPELTFPLLLANGVTGVRDMNGPMPVEEVRALRRRVERGEVLGPRFVTPGALIDSAGRPPGALGPQVVSVATPEEARAAVRSLQSRGADFIKVYNRLTPELHAAVAAEARARGLHFAGHVPHGVSTLAAADAGQRSMEHFQGILEAASTEDEARRELMLENVRHMAAGESLTPDGIRRFREFFRNMAATYDEGRAEEVFTRLVANHTWQCPTLVSNRMLFLSDIDESFAKDPRLKYIPEAVRKTWSGPNPRKRILDDPAAQRQRYRRILEAAGTAHRHGVPFLAGTDLSVAYVYAGFSLHDELALLVEAGLEPEAALLSATRNPAEYLGALGEMGTVEAGKLADLVLLEADPLLDIANTRRISAVVADGRLLDRPALDRMLADAAVAGISTVTRAQ